jgi:hypothetical protein
MHFAKASCVLDAAAPPLDVDDPQAAIASTHVVAASATRYWLDGGLHTEPVLRECV